MNKYFDRIALLVVCVFLFFGQSYSQEKGGDFLNNSRAELPVEVQVDSLLAQAARSSLILDSVLLLYQEALSVSKVEECSLCESRVTFEMGKFLMDRRIHKRGLENILKSIDSYGDRSPSPDLMLRYKYAGIGYNGLGETIKSIEYYDKSLEIAQVLNRVEDVARIKNNIGIVYLDQDHFDKSVEYFKGSLELDPSAEIKIVVLGNLGLAEAERLNYDLALEYYSSALQTAKSTDDEIGEMFIKEIMTSLFYRKGDYKECLDYSLELIEKYERLKLSYDISVVYNRVGLSYSNMGRHDEANKYYKKSLTLSKELNTKEVVWIYRYLAFNEAKRMDYKEAYDNLKIHLDYRDSLFSLEKTTQVEEALAKYEAEKKEKEIAILEAQKELQEANVATQTMITDVTLGASGIIMIVLVLFILNYAQKLKNQEKMAEQQEVINSQRTLDLIKGHEIDTIKANVKGQEEERVRLARELHDGIAGSLAAVKMKISKSNANSELLDNIDLIYNEVRDLSHGLTPVKVVHEPLVSLIQNYIEDLNEGGVIDFQLIVGTGLDFIELNEVQKVALYRIMQELIFNVFKHSKATFAELQLTRNDEIVNVILEDNGVGFDKNKKVKGIGVKNVTQRVEALGGEMNIDSVIGRGTIINIDFPFVNSNV